MSNNATCIYVLHAGISWTVNVTHSKAFVIISVTSMHRRPQTTGWNYPNVSARITHALLYNLVCITPWIICTVTIVASSFASFVLHLKLYRRDLNWTTDSFEIVGFRSLEASNIVSSFVKLRRVIIIDIYDIICHIPAYNTYIILV